MGGFAQNVTSFGIGGEAGSVISQIGLSTAAGCAAGPLGCAAGAVSGTVKAAVTQLTQHTARLKGAKNENAALNPVVVAFDADVAAIRDAYNNGGADAATCIAACAAVDANIQANLKSHVGAPGTAWSTAVGMQGKCNKLCTAGCCVYYGDLGPVLSMMVTAMGGAPLVPLWGRNDPRYHATANGATINVPEVIGSKYGATDRPGYTLTITAPPPQGKVQAGLLGIVSELTGAPPPSLAGLLPEGMTSVSPTLIILGVVLVFGAILLAVFGSR